MPQLFVPGFGALPSFYRAALPAEWILHEPPPLRTSRSLEDRVAALRRSLDEHTQSVTLGGHSMGAALAVAVAVLEPMRVERLLLVGPAGLPLTKPVGESLRDCWRQVASGMYTAAQIVRAFGNALVAPRATFTLARAVRDLDLTVQFQALRRRGVPCDVVGCLGDTLTPVSHCRQIAELAGARYHEIDVAGGHMWMLVEPSAFGVALGR
jgi:pimeloyl-ACP methyl ester carboxylesterase